MMAFSPMVAIPAATMPIFQILLMVVYLKLAGRIRTYFDRGVTRPRRVQEQTQGADMNIKILGTGCPNCQRLEALVREVAATSQLEPEVDKVTEIPDIMAYGVMSTPGLVIDGELKAAGRIPSKGEIEAWLHAAAAPNDAGSSGQNAVGW